MCSIIPEAWNIHTVMLSLLCCNMNRSFMALPRHCALYYLAAGLEEVPISPWLVTLLHISGVIPTPQSPISPETPCRYQGAEHRCLCIKRRCLCIERRYRRIEWWVFRDVSQCFKCFMMFHNVLRVFHSILLVVHDVLWRLTMYHNVLQVFHNVLLCLTMIYDV